MAQANVGFRRLQQLLGKKEFLLSIQKIPCHHNTLELAEYKNQTENSNFDEGNISVEMRDTSYSWELLKSSNSDDNNEGESSEIPTLFNINLKIEKGSLTGVAGLVGSGKSSLLSAMLGEVRESNHKHQLNSGSISDEVNNRSVKC